jgi:hypothetical protein
MNRTTTIIIALIFGSATMGALALERHATKVLIPRWCAANPTCAATRHATSADPLRF